MSEGQRPSKREPKTRTGSKAARSWRQRAFYVAAQQLCRFLCVVSFRLRCHHRERMPRQGPVLVCANHQSYLDPILVGVTFNRRLNYLARRTLFDKPFLGRLIGYLDAIPLEREGLGVAGIKESLRRLRRGECLLVFPEGTRTRDGAMGRFKPGFCVLARRAEAWLLPVAIKGAYDAWPRTARWPRPRRIRVAVGEPISPQFVKEVDDETLVSELQRRVAGCLEDLPAE